MTQKQIPASALWGLAHHSGSWTGCSALSLPQEFDTALRQAQSRTRFSSTPNPFRRYIELILESQELALKKASHENSTKDIHKLLIEAKLKTSLGQSFAFEPAFQELQNLFQLSSEYRFDRLSRQSFETYRNQINTLQKQVYEPARQTAISKFAEQLDHEFGVGLVLSHENNIIAQCFAGPLSINQKEGLVDQDPYLYQNNVVYMLDCTVAPEFQGKNLGRFLKYALVLECLQRGIHRIHGRNRDQMAKGMMSINLSLGSYEWQLAPNAYDDDLENRSVWYYFNPLTWTESLCLSDGASRLCSFSSLSSDWISSQLETLIHEPWESYLNQLKMHLSKQPDQNDQDLTENFGKKLTSLLQSKGISEIDLKDGKGWYRGPNDILSPYTVEKDDDRCLIDCNPDTMRSFLNHFR